MPDRTYGAGEPVEIPKASAGHAPIAGEITADGRATTRCSCGWNGPADDYPAHRTED